MDLTPITDNWELIVGAIVGLLAILKLAFKFTKSTKDDEVLEEISEALEDAGVIPDDGDDR